MSVSVNSRVSSISLRLLAVVAVMFGMAAQADFVLAQESPDRIDFNRDIRPVLSNHCFQCHGADEGARETEFRLDVRASAIEHEAIVPGSPHDSPLFERVTTADESLRMPPQESGKPLSPAQIELLRRWIEEGAEYQDHWAFRQVERPPVPRTANPWTRNAIDAFVLDRLLRAELTPSDLADRETLIRRATQDVIGLLPTPEETDQFLHDKDPDAWEKVVDRLLASPHYGERWGRHWLDQARYADSNGYTIDGPRVMWPYRDWVIAALNRDMPFDQFTIEQLAGDLLPNATLAQKVATAFHRNTMINEEGGVKPDQYRNEALIDRVNTTGAVWLGLTVGCAQCHSHKFDPFTQEEYYRLYAFFNGAVDANNAGETVDVRHGEMLGWSDEQHTLLAQLLSLRREKAELEKQAASQTDLSSLTWNWQPAQVTAIRASGSIILSVLPDGSLLAKSEPNANDAYSLTFTRPDSLPADAAVTAIRLRTLTHDSLPAGGPGTASNGNFVLTDVSLKSGSEEKRFAQAWADHGQNGYPVDHAIDEKTDTGWAINVDGAQTARGLRMNAPHEAIFALAEPVSFVDNALTLVMRHDVNKNYLVGHFSIEFSTVNALPPSPETPDQKRLSEVAKRISDLESLLPGKGASVKQMVMKDLDQIPETYLLSRGDFLVPDKDRGPLKPGVPAALGPADATPYANRLDLARWLVSRDNPLTARVTVNRVWAKYFGRGLVETENDFGFQGTPPTHPELLDWLAAEFVEHGWSLKYLHRTILLSATYCQSSAHHADDHAQQTIDPENYLLSRQNRFRVEAEIVRDQAVFASGLFTPNVGGPGIHLPQPDGIYDFTQNKKDWPTAQGPDRYRRTMYTMFYRSAPYPLLSTFDAPDFSTVCTRRVRSNTPLQSLTTANDLVFVELAEGLARRILTAQSLNSDDERLTEMFRICLTRTPEDRERAVLQEYLSREMARFSGSPDDAANFVQTRDADLAVEVLAAWTSVARALFNSDEFLMRN
jgi:hypothetical protein